MANCGNVRSVTPKRITEAAAPRPGGRDDWDYFFSFHYKINITRLLIINTTFSIQSGEHAGGGGGGGGGGGKDIFSSNHGRVQACMLK